MRRIAHRRSSQPEIPTASTADVAFLLIIFFMVSTVFRQSRGLKITLPEAEATERILKRRNVASVWVDRTGKMTVDDNLVTPAIVTSVMAEKVIDNPDLVVTVQADRDVSYGYVTDILEALKDARALKVTFATEYRMGRGG
ncbi:MAG: biopolymer transporter ExbD [candidate division WOR-3 bacterium]